MADETDSKEPKEPRKTRGLEPLMWWLIALGIFVILLGIPIGYMRPEPLFR